jgi:hypothetical protein
MVLAGLFAAAAAKPRQEILAASLLLSGAVAFSVGLLLRELVIQAAKLRASFESALSRLEELTRTRYVRLEKRQQESRMYRQGSGVEESVSHQRAGGSSDSKQRMTGPGVASEAD